MLIEMTIVFAQVGLSAPKVQTAVFESQAVCHVEREAIMRHAGKSVKSITCLPKLKGTPC